MNESEAGAESVFEVDRIRRLVELMKEHDLSEVDLREARQRIRICRGPKEPPRSAYGPPPPPPPPPAPAPAAPIAARPAAAAESPNTAVIKSPMVGTFYGRPNPKAEAFVKVGDRVDTTTTVCIIEAMKVFNEIPAEIRGRIVAILCEDGEAVEFDKPLFKVDTSA
jgi:acetyl-CoA carboxylase biotin carboxyl carrier protein